MDLTLPTIIIPAYNEETVIEDTLVSLGSGELEDFNIIVACNGCTDNTIDIIRRRFSAVHCLETEEAGKILAIRCAEALNPGFPRLYLDADIHLSISAVRNLFKAAIKYDDKLVVPSSSIRKQKCSLFVRAYYKIWYESPFVRQHGYGAGAYILTQTARSKFEQWPNVISDDGFVRLFFKKNELRIICDSIASVAAPKTLFQLIKTKSRIKSGALELQRYRQSMEYLYDSDLHLPNKKWLYYLFFKFPFAAFCYILINLCILLSSKLLVSSGEIVWLRDDSNR